uniref:Uncharacterized protein n=1 Tax=Anguilla anguilla TaxID=7936 RepID=A0A0E9S9A5_ANGAN
MTTGALNNDTQNSVQRREMTHTQFNYHFYI